MQLMDFYGCLIDVLWCIGHIDDGTFTWDKGGCFRLPDWQPSMRSVIWHMSSETCPLSFPDNKFWKLWHRHNSLCNFNLKIKFSQARQLATGLNIDLQNINSGSDENNYDGAVSNTITWASVVIMVINTCIFKFNFFKSFSFKCRIV